MTFTDDDLKRLKEIVDDENGDAMMGYTWSKLKALLARLEAAENFIKEYENPAPDIRYRRNLLQAWRKVAGK